jgi:hypothetical protein
VGVFLWPVFLKKPEIKAGIHGKSLIFTDFGAF